MPDPVNTLLRDADFSDPDKAQALMRLVYDDLRALASRQLRREFADRTIQPTELVHEAFLRLAGNEPDAWAGRKHFFLVAGRAMRQVLVDIARQRTAVKRGGDWKRVTLHSDLIPDDAAEEDFLELHESLERLGTMDPSLERLVELRFFTGLTLDETAAAMGVSRRKVAKDWAAARLWLIRELRPA